MAVYALGDAEPTIAASAFVHPDAVVIGHVEIGEDSTVWPTAVLRGDDGQIRVPARWREGAVTPGQFQEAADLYVERGRRYRLEMRRLA